METILYSAFPGTGKTYFCQNTDLNAIDSDSSKFDKAGFPANYIRHIKKNIGVMDVICISSHKEVRNALVESNLPFTLVYPTSDQREIYMDRHRNRKHGINTEAFIDLLSDNWDNWLLELRNQNHCEHLVLRSGEFLSQRVNGGVG